MTIFVDELIVLVKEIFISLLPLLIIFLIFQFIRLKLPKEQFLVIIRGIVLTFVGLVLFLLGIKVGFIRVGELIGQTLGTLDHNWILIPIGFLLGLLVTLAEPGVRILALEVEKVTGGYISRKIILYFLAIGVALAVALSMFRMLKGISLWYFLLPGYCTILTLMWFVKPMFVAIAFDSGGFATGPMITTFMLALMVGSSAAIKGSNPLLDAFGMVAMVAMVPIFSVLVLGVLYKREELRIARLEKQDRLKEEKEIGNANSISQSLDR